MLSIQLLITVGKLCDNKFSAGLFIEHAVKAQVLIFIVVLFWNKLSYARFECGLVTKTKLMYTVHTP